jgi:DNA-binding NtrC family response regulator
LKRILFVDDDHLLLQALRRALHGQRHQWQMQFALGAEAALAALAAQPFDVVVSDMRMPGMDGVQLLSIVGVKYPSSRRVILSGYADPDVLDRAREVAHAHLAKPCDLDVLTAAIENRWVNTVP